MSIQHIQHKSKRTPEELVQLRADRERYQRDKPAPEELLAEGGHPSFIAIGQLLALRQLAAWLKRERERQHLTLAKLEERTAIDQAALSRLETGKNANPTFDTICRVGRNVLFLVPNLSEDSASNN